MDAGPDGNNVRTWLPAPPRTLRRDAGPIGFRAHGSPADRVGGTPPGADEPALRSTSRLSERARERYAGQRGKTFRDYAPADREATKCRWFGVLRRQTATGPHLQQSFTPRTHATAPESRPPRDRQLRRPRRLTACDRPNAIASVTPPPCWIGRSGVPGGLVPAVRCPTTHPLDVSQFPRG